MGKKDKKNKKGKGAEKTANKTEKKISNKMKKELAAIGEDDVETIIKQIAQEEQKRLLTTESPIEHPSRRLNFSFIAHPDKDQLILYGGEYFNGQKTIVYNDLFFYNISNNIWTVVKGPLGPPPRCGHQMTASSANKGQLWVFGGEFISPTQSQFYHYRDLWVYHISKKQWEKINAANGPSARSGHRMVLVKKQLIIFGGFHDNLRECKYYNDAYSFNIETYKWNKLDISGTPPAPRSACCMVPLMDGRILICGGYSKENIKKDVEKGCVYTDSFILTPDKNDQTGCKWKWVSTKLGGFKPSPRCSMPITVATNGLFAYTFGGVFDSEDEENISGQFFNDFLQLDLEKLTWKYVVTRNKQTNSKENDNNCEKMEIIENVEDNIETTISDDGIFKVSIASTNINTINSINSSIQKEVKNLQPSPRISSGLAVKHGVLYLYGGMVELGDKQITYNDFYSIDLKKMNEWKTLKSDNISNEWLESDSESDDTDGINEDNESTSEDDEMQE